MDTSFVDCIVSLFKKFSDCAGQDGIAKGDEVDKFIEKYLKGLLQNSKTSDKVKALLSKIQDQKEKGINKVEFADFVCDFIRAIAKGDIEISQQ